MARETNDLLGPGGSPRRLFLYQQARRAGTSARGGRNGETWGLWPAHTLSESDVVVCGVGTNHRAPGSSQPRLQHSQATPMASKVSKPIRYRGRDRLLRWQFEDYGRGQQSQRGGRAGRAKAPGGLCRLLESMPSIPDSATVEARAARPTLVPLQTSTLTIKLQQRKSIEKMARGWLLSKRC
ncbi:hypothetical protein BKA81DRAFT_401439 [Phyllosticta paracitricarpa]